MADKDNNVISMKRRFRPNISIAIFLFLVIVVYIIILVFSYFSKEHISIYEVNETDISDDSPLYGFVLRSEEVVNTEEAGYINYFFAEGSRIGKGDVAYTLDNDGTVSQVLDQLQEENADSTTDISQIRQIIASYQSSFSMSNYGDVEGLRYDIQSEIFNMNNGSLYSDLKKELESSGQTDKYTKITTNKSGIIAYTVDGYEDITKDDITKDIFDEYGNVVRKQLQTTESVDSGSPVYRIITSNDWSIAVKLDETYYDDIKDLDTVRVTVTKDNISFNASVELFDVGEDHFALLSTSRYMERYINDRFLQIEFDLNSASGLKIPNSSIMERELFVVPDDMITSATDGTGVVRQITDENGEISHEFVSLSSSIHMGENYYVNSQTLQEGDVLIDSSGSENYVVGTTEKISGVYYVNEGYCQFKPVEVQYQNKEYSIISDQTENGLTTYDHIVVDPSNLNDDDFIE